VIEILPENAIPLLAMADHYCIEVRLGGHLQGESI
jgi:hypothetical protein